MVGALAGRVFRLRPSLERAEALKQRIRLFRYSRNTRYATDCSMQSIHSRISLSICPARGTKERSASSRQTAPPASKSSGVDGGSTAISHRTRRATKRKEPTPTASKAADEQCIRARRRAYAVLPTVSRTHVIRHFMADNNPRACNPRCLTICCRGGEPTSERRGITPPPRDSIDKPSEGPLADDVVDDTSRTNLHRPTGGATCKFARTFTDGISSPHRSARWVWRKESVVVLLQLSRSELLSWSHHLRSRLWAESGAASRSLSRRWHSSTTNGRNAITAAILRLFVFEWSCEKLRSFHILCRVRTDRRRGRGEGRNWRAVSMHHVRILDYSAPVSCHRSTDHVHCCECGLTMSARIRKCLAHTWMWGLSSGGGMTVNCPQLLKYPSPRTPQDMTTHCMRGASKVKNSKWNIKSKLGISGNRQIPLRDKARRSYIEASRQRITEPNRNASYKCSAFEAGVKL